MRGKLEPECTVPIQIHAKHRDPLGTSWGGFVHSFGCVFGSTSWKNWFRKVINRFEWEINGELLNKCWLIDGCRDPFGTLLGVVLVGLWVHIFCMAKIFQQYLFFVGN